RNITIDVVSRFVKGRIRRLFGVVVNTISAGMVMVLIVVSLSYIGRKMEDGSVAFTIPMEDGNWIFQEWWFATIIPMGFGLMAWHFVVHAWLYLVDEQVEESDPDDDEEVEAAGGDA
ncbi:MAG: TRAP transporter small permease subunit, partial [Deltaproteobacteria bacterium]|nr:TRAP transporter small permease subunit [Deltaproteobacteria bacterium]